MSKQYQVIYADPPWSYDNKCLNRGGAERHYSTMSVADIQRLPISQLADKDCVLFMWATFPKLIEAFQVIEAWGFNYKTCAFVWVKTNKRTNPNQLAFLPADRFDSFIGMGRWTRSNAEICLLATKGSPKRESASVRQIIYEPIDQHSRKPPVVREQIVQLCGDVPRVELFARQLANGWDSWGNQVKTDLVMEYAA